MKWNGTRLKQLSDGESAATMTATRLAQWMRDLHVFRCIQRYSFPFQFCAGLKINDERLQLDPLFWHLALLRKKCFMRGLRICWSQAYESRRIKTSDHDALWGASLHPHSSPAHLNPSEPPPHAKMSPVSGLKFNPCLRHVKGPRIPAERQINDWRLFKTFQDILSVTIVDTSCGPKCEGNSDKIVGYRASSSITTDMSCEVATGSSCWSSTAFVLI